MRDSRWVLIAIEGWVWLQYAAAAYSRAVGYASPRYKDIFIIGALVGLAALPWLRPRFLQGAWAAAVTAAFAAHFWTVTLPEFTTHAKQRQAQTSNTQAFLHDGNIEHLRKPYMEAPYPKPDVLASKLKDPTLHRMLPPQLVPENERGGVAKLIEDWMLRYGWLFACAGIGVIVHRGMAKRDGDKCCNKHHLPSSGLVAGGGGGGAFAASIRFFHPRHHWPMDVRTSRFCDGDNDATSHTCNTAVWSRSSTGNGLAKAALGESRAAIRTIRFSTVGFPCWLVSGK